MNACVIQRTSKDMRLDYK